MFKTNIKELNQRDCYTNIKNSCRLQIANIEIDIELLKAMPEETVVGDKALSQIFAGVQARQILKPKEAIELLKKEIGKLEKRIETANKLVNL